MNRLRAPPVVANKKKQQKISLKIGIDTRKGMTMNQKNKKGKRLTSTFMAVLMSVSTTLTPVNSMASEPSVTVESQMEETTVETEETTVSAQTETDSSEEIVPSDEVPVEETTVEATTVETESSVAEEVKTSGKSVEETSTNETRGPDENEEAMAEMDEKDFSEVIDEEKFTADRVWDYNSYDAFAESMTGVSLQRTEQTMQFYNTYVDASQVQAGVTTIDGLLDSNADWYSNEYILGLNPEMFKETVPIYYGADGNYYVVSTAPTLNEVESVDYQPATNFYNGSVEAQAFTDIEYLGNGVYCIPNSRYQYCFTEQYVSDMGMLYGISFGLRIQVLYGFTPSGEITIPADVLYPDMTERFLPATLNLLAGTATVRVFNDDYDDSTDNYLVSASINRGASLPDSVGSMNEGKVLQFVVNDANAVGSLDILIGYDATSKYSMAAEVTTQDLYSSTSNANINLAAEMYNGVYLKLNQESVPNDLAVGDKFIYESTGLTITGVETSYDLSNKPEHPDQGIHVGAKTIPTHDAQSFCFYNGKGADSEISTWFKTQLNTNSADPGYMVQMTVENMQSRAAWNGTTTNLRQSQFPNDKTPQNHIFGYLTDGLGTVSGTDGKVLNLEGTNVLLSCMHAWGNESDETPADILESISVFTGRTQRDYAEDKGFGHYKPNIALQCTEVSDGGDGYMYATFKVVTSMLSVGGVKHANNYQCAFSTLRIAYPSAPKTGFLRIHKSSADPTMTNENSCYNFEGIQYGIFADEACVDNLGVLSLDADGYTQPYELPEGTYYVREVDATGSGYKTNDTVYTVNVIAGTIADAPVTCETVDEPLNDPLGIQINKINGDGTTTADLSGAEYTITYYPKQYTSVAEIEADTASEVKPTVWVIQTIKSSSGYFASLDDAHIVPNSDSAGAVFGTSYTGTYIIPLGTITVEETKAPTGFTRDGAIVSSAKTGETISGTHNVYLFQLVDENSAVYLKSGNELSTPVDDETSVTLTYEEVQNKAGIHLVKYDATTGGIATGDGDLSGIKFAIVNNTGFDIVNYAGYTIANGEVAQVIITNSEGYAATGSSDLPVGSYIVRELRMDAGFDGQTLYEGYSPLANSWYQWQENTDIVTLTDNDANGFVWARTFYDYPVTGIPVMEKHDLELNKKAAMGGTSFDGIVFEIYNGSDNAVVIDGTSYAKDEVVATAVSDADGTITTTTTFPAGRYYVKEKSVNGQYTLTDEEVHYFSVISGDDGVVTVKYENDQNAVIFNDRVVRGDLLFVKKNAETDETLAYIPFKITNNTTGETHYILTDADGSFTSATGKTTNTNANDEVLSQYGERDVISQSVIDSLTKDAGLWFGLGSEGTMTDANDSYGSFVYGTYTITELKTEVTRNMKMYTNTFTIDTDGTTLDLGIVNNIPMSIQTTLIDEKSGGHFAEATKSVTLVDHVAYRNLDTDKIYTLTGTLYVKDGDAITALVTETVDFQPTEAESIQDVIFTIDASKLKGKSVVAFEELSINGELYAAHKDKNDENQMVSFPDLQTTACDSLTSDHVSNADGFITVIDTVKYSGLHVGEKYTISGILMNQKTGKTVLDDDGNEITASVEFMAEKTNGTVDVTFGFSGVSLAGTTVVVFENLYFEDALLAVHADMEDDEQTVYIPEIHTTAKDKTTQINHMEGNKNATIVDTVYYSNLLPGKEYVVSGKLMDQKTGEVIQIDGKEIIASTIFTPITSEGSVEVVFEFDAAALVSKTVVVFEDLTYEKIKVATHADIEDEDQMIYIPKIRTNAISDDTKSHVVEAKKDITIIDTVSYEGLEVGREYIMKGMLMDQKTGKALKIDDKEVIAETTFTAETASGIIDVSFVFDGEKLENTVLVAYEKLYTDGKEIAAHTDIEDEDQTIYIPKIRTHAQDAVTDIDHTEALPQAKIIDIVTYSSLLPGKEYTITGTLMNQKTGEAILIDGEKITASTTFTAETSEGSVEMVFYFDASIIAPTTVVAFEKMEYEGVEIAVHADIEDENQTIYIPAVHTTATAMDTNDHIVGANEKVTITDEVELTGLKVGNEYILNGVLMNKETEEELRVNGESITAKETFRAEATQMIVTLTYTLDATDLAGATTVVYETLYTEGKEIGKHHEINDENQTVHFPEIHTTATDQETGGHESTTVDQTTVLDEVFYKNLIPGKAYTVKGTLMVKETKEPLIVDGKKITAEKTFVAEKADGSIVLAFSFCSLALAGKHVVVFEDVEYEGVLIGTHADIEDENQTVSIPVQPEIPPVITGDNSTPLPYVAGLVTALLAAVAIIIVLIKKRKQA